MVERIEDKPAKDGHYTIESWPCSGERARARMIYPEAGRRWEGMRIEDVPVLLGDLFEAADLWVEILHLEISPRTHGTGSHQVARVDVSLHAVMPPDFPPRGYYPSTLLLDFLHSWMDSLKDVEGDAPRLPMLIGVNRGGMFWRMAPEHVGRATPTAQ